MTQSYIARVHVKVAVSIRVFTYVFGAETNTCEYARILGVHNRRCSLRMFSYSPVPAEDQCKGIFLTRCIRDLTQARDICTVYDLTTAVGMQ